MTKITAQYAFVIYMSVKNHFDSGNSYSLAKYGYLHRLHSSFEKRKDKRMFETMVKRYPSESDWRGFLIANFLVNPNQWIGEMQDDIHNNIFLRWLGRTSNMMDIFKKDSAYVAKVVIERHMAMDAEFVNTITDMMINEGISPESFLIFKKIFPKIFQQVLDKNMVYAYGFKNKLDSYQVLLEFEESDKYKQKFEEVFKQQLRNWSTAKWQTL